MVVDGNYIYYSEHCLMYQIVESLCCEPETNLTVYVNYTSVIKILKGVGLKYKLSITLQRRQTALFTALYKTGSHIHTIFDLRTKNRNVYSLVLRIDNGTWNINILYIEHWWSVPKKQNKSFTVNPHKKVKK